MPIAVERRGATAVVTVEREEQRNALDPPHAEELADRLGELAEDASVRAVVLTGAGEKAFVAGADIRAMRELDVLGARRFAELGHAIATLLETMPKPTVAAVNGVALGGGCELALACDIRLASTGARLGLPEVGLGILPGWGGTSRLARATSLAFAKELILTGRIVDADEALSRGLVSAVYEPGELMAKALALCDELAAKAPLALAAAKEATNAALQGEHRANLATEALLFATLFATADRREGMDAFVEKREARFRGA